jgi:hypothetical protein
LSPISWRISLWTMCGVTTQRDAPDSSEAVSPMISEPRGTSSLGMLRCLRLGSLWMVWYGSVSSLSLLGLFLVNIGLYAVKNRAVFEIGWVDPYIRFNSFERQIYLERKRGLG